MTLMELLGAVHDSNMEIEVKLEIRDLILTYQDLSGESYDEV